MYTQGHHPGHVGGHLITYIYQSGHLENHMPTPNHQSNPYRIICLLVTISQAQTRSYTPIITKVVTSLYRGLECIEASERLNNLILYQTRNQAFGDSKILQIREMEFQFYPLLSKLSFLLPLGLQDCSQEYDVMPACNLITRVPGIYWLRNYHTVIY